MPHTVRHGGSPIRCPAVVPEPDAPTLIVGDASSHCSTCRRRALLDEATHATIPGLTPLPGCGVRWTHLATAHDAHMITERIVSGPNLRSDLNYVGRWTQ